MNIFKQSRYPLKNELVTNGPSPQMKKRISSDQLNALDEMRRSSSSNHRQFSVLSHSPSPLNRHALNRDMELSNSYDSSYEENVDIFNSVTPPLRTNNPIILNSPFAERSRQKKGVEIGLFCPSPPLDLETIHREEVGQSSFNRKCFSIKEDDFDDF